MKLEFNSKQEHVEELYFKDVKNNQLFVTQSGTLCQKVDEDRYNILCNSVGNLYARHADAGYARNGGGNWRIKHIFNDITGIKITE